MRAFADFLVRLRKEKPLAVVLGIVLLLLIGVALLADVLAPFAPNEVFLMDRLQGSSARYPLGTDQLGRDFASRLIYGARLTLGVGLAATAVNVLVALVVGGVSGFIGGRLDLTVQRFVDAWMSIPGLLILLTVMSVVGRGVLQIIVVLGGIGASRVVRGAVIGAKENAYFEAARAVVSSRWRTLVHHLLPNIAPVLIVIYSINIGAVVISEASLSFLGVRAADHGAELGRHAEPRGAPVHGDRAAAGGVAGPVPDGGGLQPEHVRRRGARPARPAAARRQRPARRLRRAGGRKSRGDSTARAEVTHPDRGASHKRREAGRPVSGRRWPDVIPGVRGRGDR